ncbi:hypothetical protein [Streptomyces sp. NPDC094149]|uniref:hypothetical protein n=1 Tax=Streptomyces sp. NPDC094149 TaxID=3155079 RepID=UPI00332CB187
MQLIINTQRDTYEQAIAAVQAAYGFNPAPTTDGWPEAPTLEPRPGPQDLSEDDLWQGWSERLLFDTIAALMPGARTVLRRIADVGCTATYDDVQAHFASHPETPIPKNGSAGPSALLTPAPTSCDSRLVTGFDVRTLHVERRARRGVAAGSLPDGRLSHPSAGFDRCRRSMAGSSGAWWCPGPVVCERCQGNQPGLVGDPASSF